MIYCSVIRGTRMAAEWYIQWNYEIPDDWLNVHDSTCNNTVCIIYM